MTHRDHFFSILEGKRPKRMPFFPDITDWYVANRVPPGQARPYGPGDFIPDDDPIHKLPGTLPDAYRDFTLFDFYRHFNWGFHVHISNWFERTYDGGVRLDVREQGDRKAFTYHTPRGSITRVDRLASDGSWSRQEFFVKTPDDLKTMQVVVEHTHFVPRFERVDAIRDALGGWGQGDIVLSRSPFGKLVHEYMGFENVIYALFDNPDPLLAYMDVQERLDLELVALAAQAPERLVILSDHADETLIAPRYWKDYCAPHYRKVCAMLHGAGKFVSTHLDGNFKGFFPYLHVSGFDLLDGCTPAPMFNYTVEELAAAMPPGMSAFCGVPATLFCQGLPTDDILAFGDRIRKALRGRGVLNVGDILPPNGDIEQVIALGRHAGCGA
ncbi:MAG: hypothetical protein K8T26_15455 [Lentisphaerae bacterium]|nr:hypothetical protein [Lentisphaerota bacterium]